MYMYMCVQIYRRVTVIGMKLLWQSNAAQECNCDV